MSLSLMSKLLNCDKFFIFFYFSVAMETRVLMNLPPNLMQPFTHPNDATHNLIKIGQLASEIFKFKSVKFSSLKSK